MAKLVSVGRTIGGTGIAKNSLTLEVGDLLTIKGGFVDKAVAGDTVVSIAGSAKVYEADNETRKKAKVNFDAFDNHSLFEVEVEGGTISQANVEAVFDLNADGNVDGATAGAGTQVKLRKVLSDTKGVFSKAK